MSYGGSLVAITTNAVGASTANPTGTYTHAVAAGNTLTLGLAMNGTPSSVTDSAGNTFTLVATGTVNTTYRLMLYAVKNCAAVTTSTVVTVNFGGSSNEGIGTGDYWLTADGTSDATAASSQSSSTSVSVGPTGSVAQAAEFMVAYFGGYILAVGAPGFTTGGAFTAGSTASAGDLANFTFYIYAEYQVLTNASGTYTATGTLGAAADVDTNALATFKDGAADPFPVGYSRPPDPRLRMHHRELPQPRHRRQSGLYLLHDPRNVLPGTQLHRAA